MAPLDRKKLLGTVAWLGVNRDDSTIYAATHDRETAEAWMGASNAVMELGVVGALRPATNRLPSDHVIIEAAENPPFLTVHQTVRIQRTGEEYERVVHIDEAYGKTIENEDDRMIDALAEAMKAKLCVTARKGRGGWQGCEPEELRRQLGDALCKGDPVDVANYCMMLFALGERIDMGEMAAYRMELIRQGEWRKPVSEPVDLAQTPFESMGTVEHRSVDGKVERVKLHVDESKLTPQQRRDAQFMGGINGEEWD